MAYYKHFPDQNLCSVVICELSVKISLAVPSVAGSVAC